MLYHFDEFCYFGHSVECEYVDQLVRYLKEETSASNSGAQFMLAKAERKISKIVSILKASHSLISYKFT